MTKPPTHNCPLCELIGRPDDDHWSQLRADSGDHDALLAVATPAEREQLVVAAAGHRDSDQVVRTALEAHDQLHSRFNADLVNPIIERRKEAAREARLGETRARLHQLLGQEGPGISIGVDELETRIREARQRADDAESDWRILHDYGVGAGLIEPAEPPF